MRGRGWIVVVGTLIGSAVTMVEPRRAEAGPLFDKASSAFDRVEYAEAATLVKQALKDEPLDRAEVERAYFLLGSALLGDGDAAHADLAFQVLVALKPDYRPDAEVAPKVAESLRRAVARVGAPATIETPVQTGTTIEADVHAPSVLTPALEHLVAGAPVREPLRCLGSRCEGRVPTATATRIGFLTAEGAFVLAVAVAAPTVAIVKRTPVYKRWWLWTAVGVVVIGGVAGGVAGGVLAARASKSIDLSLHKTCGGADCSLWAAP